jgi:hypothetical protein
LASPRRAFRQSANLLTRTRSERAECLSLLSHSRFVTRPDLLLASGIT